jgi:2-hydroxy-6-oxonona-2,4-dienedioate hydrolase
MEARPRWKFGLNGHGYTVPGRRMFARVSAPGRGGPPLILLHGLAVSSRYMIPLAEELARSHDVYCPDLPGFGRSDTPRRSLSIPELAAALHEWVRAARLSSAVVIGHSTGCQVLVELAHVAPDLIRNALLLGPTTDVEARSPAAHAWRLFRDQFVEPKSLVPLQAFECLRFGPIRTVQTFRAALRHDMLDRIGGLRVPSVVIRGQRDPISPQRWCEALVRRMPAGTLRVIRGAGHAVNYSSPHAVAMLVRELLNRSSVCT